MKNSALISIGNKRKVGLVSIINKKKTKTTIVENETSMAVAVNIR